MPIDFSILSQGLDQPTPYEQNKLRRMQMASATQQNALGQLQLEAARRGVEEENQLRQLYAAPNADYTSPEFIRKASAISPKTGLTLAKEARAAQKESYQSGLAKHKLDTAKIDTAIRYITSFDTRKSILADIARKEASGELPADMAAKVRSALPATDADVPAWQLKTLRSLLSAKDQMEVRAKQSETDEKRFKEAYLQDTLNRQANGEAALTPEQFRATLNAVPAAAPAPMPAAAPVSANGVVTAPVPMPGGIEVSGGEKMLPAVPVAGALPDINPQALELYRVGTPEAVKIADQLQTRYLENKKKPSSIRELELYNKLSPEEKKAFEKLQKIKGTSVNVSMGEGPKAVDKKYAEDYLNWVSGGGADAAANAAQIKGVLDRLAAGEALTGKSIGLAPDFFNAIMNPAALDAKSQVEEVVQRNLRAVLGAQFTQVEGERLISRAFDARLSPQDNAKRLRKLFMQLETAVKQKQAMADYYEQHETLRGFKGKQPSIQDFYSVLNAPSAPPKDSVDLTIDGKTYRFESKEKADAFKRELKRQNDLERIRNE